VLLADFVNTTSDAVFDQTLKEALSVDLAQSPFLNTLSDQTLAETLKMMGRPRTERLVGDIARQVCLRSASTAYIGGSIANLGSKYVIELKAVNCQTGDALAQEERSAGRKEDVLPTLHSAAERLRERVGESIGSIRKFDLPLLQATTPSLEALQAYTVGRERCFQTLDFVAGMDSFESAIRMLSLRLSRNVRQPVKTLLTVR
jgi:hypothetical protein